MCQAGRKAAMASATKTPPQVQCTSVRPVSAVSGTKSEPVDQAAAVIPCAADLLAATDFTPHLLNDMRAPMVTVILEEQALAPARVLARVPYLEHLLGLVQQGCEPAQLPAACAPALVRAHADLAIYLATLLAGLFDGARLAALSKALADYQQLGDPAVLARTLLAQINYTADVAANMPPHTYTTGSGIFRFAWRARQNSTTIVLRLRTVYMYLPQPIASCLRSRGHEAHSSLSARRYRSCVPSCKSAFRWLEPRRAPPSRSNLHCGLPPSSWLAPRSGALNAPGAGSTSAGRTPGLPATAQAIRPPSASPLLADDDPSGSIRHYFLAGLFQELQTCLRRTLVADPPAEPESEPCSGSAAEAAHAA